jgi:hypothetical protein
MLMDLGFPIGGAEQGARRIAGSPAAMEAVIVDGHGRVRAGHGVAPELLETVRWRSLWRSAASSHAAYLRTLTGTIWRLRPLPLPVSPCADGAPEIPRGGDEQTAPIRRHREAESRLFCLEPLWGDDPALRDLVRNYGLTQREADIALRLGGLSPNTIRDALRPIFAKTGAHSRTEMVARILRIECPAMSSPGKS